MRLKLVIILCLLSFIVHANDQDTLNGYDSKISGDEIIYYSPLHQFAPKALLTRASGKMPIQWKAPLHKGKKQVVVYELLIGHSTGTSSGIRQFELSLNEHKLFTFQTKPGMKMGDRIGGVIGPVSFSYTIQDQDINHDAFGKLYIAMPSEMVKEQALFKLHGLDSNSRDWMMVFMYKRAFQMEVEAGNLLVKKENKRRINLACENPYHFTSKLAVYINGKILGFDLKPGYNQVSFAAFNKSDSGEKNVLCILNNKDSIQQKIQLAPFKYFEFHIIHHSHNDIGYSHHQSEVERIQIQNIRDAIQWIEKEKENPNQAYWHIESLWAVENFMNTASDTEKEKFIRYIHSGNLVLSAAYANILTGLCRPDEQNWTIEYANFLKEKYKFPIQQVMTTDIPGLSASAFSAYIKNNIPYCSMGPNYVSSQYHLGDRIGGMIQEQGDQIFYWKDSLNSDKKLLVWTAGKGYSYFHGITENNKQELWEKRISAYVRELEEKKYPFNWVQLRYTKNADNGPVDQNLSSFVREWNETFESPKLIVSSIPKLYGLIEDKYAAQIPIKTGEITPYWEDGAYSTAREEMQARKLVEQTMSMEKQARIENKYDMYAQQFYRLHRSLVLFHEHTWGSWCSISDPEIPFTTSQWEFKKAFLDSAQIYADILQQIFPSSASKNISYKQSIDVIADEVRGGIKAIYLGKDKQNFMPDSLSFFQVLYASGINPTSFYQAEIMSSKVILDTKELKKIEQEIKLKNTLSFKQYFTIYKNEGRIVCRYSFDKLKEINKESMHIAFKFAERNPKLTYNKQLQYPSSQLAGSNKEFICVEDQVMLEFEQLKMEIKSPQIALFEIGQPIDENQVNGAKIWKRENQNTSSLFLYVFNNYWHTNYKAYQEGHFDFEVECIIHKK